MTGTDTHRWAVDAIEEGVVRVEEDGNRMLSVPLHLFPAGVTEGQLLRVSRERGSSKVSVVVTITIDAEATRAALEKSAATMASAMKHSKKRDPGGDVSL